MVFNTPIRLFVLASLVVLFQSAYVPAAEGQGPDAPPVRQNRLKSGDTDLSLPAGTTAELSSAGAGSVTGTPGSKAKSAKEIKSSSTVSSREKNPEVKKKKKSIFRQPSVLERFRDYRGERTPAALMALFDQTQMIGFRQIPPVVISNGKTIVRFLFVSTPERENISDVALTGGRVVASMRDPDATNAWIIVVMPEKGTDEVTMAVMQRDVLMVFPAAVAPPADIDLDSSDDVTEEDFRIFLSSRGTPSAPAYDLNGDGVRDYRDDYIFTANYLVLNPAQEHGPAAVPAPAEPAEQDESLFETEDANEQLNPDTEPPEDETSQP